MTDKLKVKQIMTKGVIVANVDNTFEQVMRFFTEYNIQHLPVNDHENIIGILSVKDMADFVFKQVKSGLRIDMPSLNASFKVSDVMTAEPTTVTETESLFRVVEILAEGKFQALPVTDGKKLVGIVTNKDIVRMLRWEYTH